MTDATDASDAAPPEAATAAMLAARYGTGRPWWARLAQVLAVVLVLAALAIGAWRGWQLSNPDATARLLAFDVVSPARVDVTFEVELPEGQAGTCVLRAQDGNRHDVGYASVLVGPAQGGTRVAGTYPLATRAEAVIAEVLGCAAGDRVPTVDPPQFPPGTSNPSQAPSLSPA